MIKGESVTVISFESSEMDELGNDIKNATEAQIENVIVFPGTRKDTTADNRPNGVIVAYTLHFPKTYTGDLTGCDVIVRGHKCRVIGHPDREPVPCPTRWNMTVEVENVEG